MNACCRLPVRMVSFYGGWLSVILSFATATTVRAQWPKISIGGGYERGDVSIEFLDQDVFRANDAFNSGINQAVGFVELAFSVRGNGLLTVAARLSGYSSTVALLAPMPEVEVMIPGGPEPRMDGIDEEISFSMRTIQFELIGRTAIVEGLRLGAGFVLGDKEIQNYRHSFLHEIPINIRPWTWPNSHLEDNGHRVVYDNEADMQYNHLAVGVLFTAEYDLPLSQQFSLVPELRLRGDFSSPFPNANWNLFSAGGAISVRYSL